MMFVVKFHQGTLANMSGVLLTHLTCPVILDAKGKVPRTAAA